MATFKSYVTVDLRYLDIWNLDKPGGSFSHLTPGGYQLNFFDNTSINVKGYGFVYGQNQGDIRDGTTTQIEYFVNGIKQSTLSGINITLAHEDTYFDVFDFQYVLEDVFSGADKIYGSSNNDYLKGFASNDVIDGSLGADTLSGGLGNDTFIVDNTKDIVIENKNEGTDLVRSTVSFSLAKNYAENLTLEGSGSINATGNGLANTLIGNGASNSLNGGAGNDILIGGLGQDLLKGSTGADTFVFQTLADSTVASAGRDTILDINLNQGDKISFKAIDALSGTGKNDAFHYIGDDAFTKHAGELRSVVSGGNTIVSGDVDGNGKADFSVLLKGIIELHTADFVL